MKVDKQLFPNGVKIGDVIEQPFRSGRIWIVSDSAGNLEERFIPKRHRPTNTHRYPPKKRKVAK